MAITVNTNLVNQGNGMLTESKYIKGTYVVVATVADLSSIPAANVVEGSLAYCQADDKFYKHNGTTWAVHEFGGVYTAGNGLQLNNAEFSINETVVPTKTYLTTNHYTKTEADNAFEAKDATILKQANIVNDVTSTTTTAPLSAAQGKALNDRIDAVSSIGRFLALWNSETGLAMSNPTTSPYAYHTGDYYRVGNVSTGTNYKPDGSSYTIGVASTVVETATVAIGDVYYFDGNVWRRQASSGGGTVQDVQVNGTSILSGGIANITDATLADVKYTEQTLSTSQKTQARTNIGAQSQVTFYILEAGD